MKINRIRISGFKSFADPVEVDILDGMTGVVGPNGCGKSNLIEALRWAMGETSAKRLRGGAMDDVIFGGTETRPPRNHCEVAISVDNPDRLGPPDFKDLKTLTVSRRLDRGDGSTYRVNGNQVKAKEVQVLYKDAGMGAGSSALVSQGMVAAIINAKPVERRNILEEAAGVAGLSSRRHEAELRLRGTEENLEKAELLEKGLNDQASSLRRQARAARRRKEIDGLIRAAEASVLLARHVESESALAAARTAQEANEEEVKSTLVELAAAERELAGAEEEARPMLQRRAEAETAYAVAKAAAENVKKEIAAARNALSAAERAIQRSAADAERESAELESVDEEIAFQQDEILGIEDSAAYDAELVEENAAAFEIAREALESAREEATLASDAHSVAAARRDALAKRVADGEQRLASAEARRRAAGERAEALRREIDALPQRPAELDALEGRLEIAEGEVSDTSEQLLAADAAAKSARAEDSSLSSTGEALAKEKSALERTETGEGAAESSTAEEGFDEALAAAVGPGFHAPLDAGETHWWDCADRQDVTHPAGTLPLAPHVEVPRHLRAAVAAVGYARDAEDAEAIAARLRPGQSVVTLDGRLWRWDGYRANLDASASEATRRKRRLAEIDARLAEIARLRGELAVAERIAAFEAAASRHAAAKAAAKAASDALSEARRTAETTETRRTELAGKLSGVEETFSDIDEQRRGEAEALEVARREIAEAPSLVATEQSLQAARAVQSERQRDCDAARIALDRVRRDAEGRAAQIASVRRQIADLERRRANHMSVIEELKARGTEAAAERDALKGNPLLGADAEEYAAVEAEERLAELTDLRDRTSALDERLAAARSRVRETSEAAQLLRENRARLLAELKAATDVHEALCREIGERIGCRPGDLRREAGLEDDAEPPDAAACEARVQRLVRERDAMGVVNLLAESQLEEIEAKVGDAAKVRGELREAVRQLRDTISKINAECRERLVEAFTAIDANFRTLFTRVFSGGDAHLRLSGSDDPLEAGLEIFASPPGKKLQTMSLFSGGEQALMALSLIFAAFLIRPSPVCVLDEVDAPFDDANVDRMCRLINDLAAEGTRFLVVTHHALTMARCDRLYGVTMRERGVSRVMTVDVAEAADYVQSSSLKD